jgi:uracil phosphoribosyltransferase
MQSTMNYLAIFDLDGTLIDTPKGIVEAFQSVLRQMGVKGKGSPEINNTIGLPLEKAFAQLLGVSTTDRAVHRAISLYQEAFKALVLPSAENLIFPGVIAGLTQLRREGFALAIATSKYYKSADSLLTAAKIRDLFDLVVGADQVIKPKPNGEMGQRIMKELGFSSGQTVMVGDTTHDMIMAKSVGIRGIAVTYGVHDAQTLSCINPDWLVSSFHDVVDKIRNNFVMVNKSPIQETVTNSNIIESLLNDSRYHIEFNGHLTNHAKHAVIALSGLGLPPEKVKEYYEHHVLQTAYGFSLEPPKPSKHRITEENWRNYLGKRTSFSSYCEFFDKQESLLGIDGLIGKYIPTLLSGWVGAFTHATIHLGWALGVKNRAMIIEGIAYMAFSYVECHPERLMLHPSTVNRDASPVDSLIRIAGLWDEDREAFKNYVDESIDQRTELASDKIHPELKRSGLQYRIARMSARGHFLIYDKPKWILRDDVSGLWEELFYAVSLVYLARPGNFVILHLITSLHAMEKIANHMPDNQKIEVIKNYWVGILCILFSGSDFPEQRKLSALDESFRYSKDPMESEIVERDWRYTIARAFQEEEEHNPKLAYVLKRLWESSGGRTIFRVAASQFTQTPDLPKTFEEAPVEEDELDKGHQQLSISQRMAEGTIQLLPQTKELTALHTIIREKHISGRDFRLHSSRIIRMLLQRSLELLPYHEKEVETPVGATYKGLEMTESVCGVSVMRAGDSMEQELRAVLQFVRIGKILIQRDKVTKLPRLYYANLPDGVANCQVLLMDPMLATGGTAVAAIEVLLQKGVSEHNIIFVNLISVAQGIDAVHRRFPKVKIVTSAIDEKLNDNAYMIPGIGDFGDRFFGTD